LSPTEDCSVFAYNGAAVTAGEVARSALFRNELQPRVAEVARKMAIEELAAERDLEADEASIDAMVERFRFENDLISAEETEAWLDLRGISPEDLQAHFTRCYWRDTLEGKLGGDLEDPPALSTDLLGMVEVDLILSGTFSPLAKAHSRRLVAGAAAVAKVRPEQVSLERGRFMERTLLEPHQVADWLNSLDRTPDWLDGMLGLEASYRASCEAILTPERLSKALAALRLPLTRLELETVEFDSIDAAREGRLCVRDDNLSLEEVARESRFPFKRLEVWADELPEDQRQKLLCAGLGEIQDPAFSEGVFRLSRVIRKTEPTLDNPTVRSRVEQRILDSHFSEASARDVRWFIQ
jgi:hypothetical protein